MRGRIGRSALVLLAALIVVSGASVAAFGLGDATSEHPVVFRNYGRGPALDLRTRTAYPPLAVNSWKKVPRLNADLVDNKNATDLEPATLRWSFGKTGDPLPFYKQVALPAGWYDVTGHVSVKSTDSADHLVGCYVFPEHQANGGDYSQVLLGQPAPSTWTYVSVSGVVYLPKHDLLELACQATDDKVAQLAPATFTARRVHVVNGPHASDVGAMRESASSGRAFLP